MNLKLFCYLLFILTFTVVQAGPLQQVFIKSTFYTVLASGNTNEIDAQLRIVRESLMPEKEAFEGALLMKKAGIVKKANDKMNLFKSGRLKLEAFISKNNANTEYRFLRLIIQENAPKIVKYRNKLEEDSRMIHTNYKSLSPVLQKIIFDYSKKSALLKIP